MSISDIPDIIFRAKMNVMKALNIRDGFYPHFGDSARGAIVIYKKILLCADDSFMLF